MNASQDLSDLIVRRLWDKLAQKPGDPQATARLAAEIRRRTDLRMNYGPCVIVNPDGTLAAPGAVHYAERRTVADAAAEAHPGPTEGQKRAGNYRLGHIQIQGLDISIETAAGNSRRPEWPPLANHYGYIKCTHSDADGDHVDVFIGPEPASEVVFVVDQVKPNGRFDEHKALIGWTNAAEAKRAYLANYAPGWTGFGGIKALTMQAFKFWLKNGDTGKAAEPQRVTFGSEEERLEYARKKHKDAAGQGMLDWGDDGQDSEN